MAIPKLEPPPAPPERKPLRPRDTRPTLFDQLLPFEWRGLIIPVTTVKVSFEQDIAEHKYWGVDSARLEATGRGSMRIEATIPLYNGIAPGKGERWSVLYPIEFRKLLKFCADGTTGVLTHPELGGIACKLKEFSFVHDAQRRDGVEISATWIETVDDDFDLAALESTSPVQMGAVAAVDLDTATTDLRGLVDDFLPPAFTETFDTAMNKLTGNFDRIRTSSSLLLNKPAQIMNRIDQLQASADALRTPNTWPLTDAADRLRESVLAVPKKLGIGVKKVGRYRTTTRATLAGLCAIVPGGAKPDDLINLNPNLLARPEVPAGTIVRHYL